MSGPLFGTYAILQNSPAFTLDPFGLLASGTFTTAGLSNPQTLTLPNSYSTATDDCIIVAVASNSGNVLSMSGAGATWVTVGQQQGSPSFFGAVFIGYGTTSGQTTCSLSGATSSADAVIAVLSDVKFSSSPVHASNHTGQNSGTGVTDPGSTGYGTHGLFLGSAGAKTSGVDFTGGGAPLLGGGLAGSLTTLIGESSTHMSVRLDAVVPTPASSGTATLGYNMPGTVAVLVSVTLDHQ